MFKRPSSAIRTASLRWLSLAVLIGVPSGRSLAQQEGRTDVAPFYEFGVPLGINRLPGAVDWCDCNGEGISYANTVGATLRFRLPEIAGPVRLFGEAGLAGSFERFTSRPYRDTARFFSDPFVVADSVWYDFIVRSGYSTVRLGLRAEADVASGVVTAVGLWGALRAGDYFEQRLRLRSDDAPAFSDGARERRVAAGDSIAADPFSWGVQLSAGLLIPAGSFSLLPELYARIDPAAVGRVGALEGMSAGASVAFRFAPSRQPDAVPEPPTEPPGDTTVAAVDPPAPEEPARDSMAPSATIELYTLDPAGRRQASVELAPRRRVYDEIVPVIPVMFADGRSAEPHPVYRAGGSSGASAPRILVESAPSRALETLAGRLREERRSVTLTGLGAAGEDVPLATERARSAAALLISRFGIDAGALTVAPSAVDRRAGRGCVLVESGASAEPAERRWSFDEVPSPAIGVTPGFQAPAGVRRWELVLRHGEQVIGAYASDRSAPFAPELSISIDGIHSDTLLAPLTAELTVEDSAGARATARTGIPVRVTIPADAVLAGAAERRTVLWIPDGDALPERGRAALRTAVEAALARLAGRLRAGDRVTVRPSRLPGMPVPGEISPADGFARGVAEMIRVVARARGIPRLDVSLGDTVEAGRTDGAPIDGALVEVEAGG